MSRIDELIQQYCPDGVPFVHVGKAFDVVATPRGVKRSDYALGALIPIVDQGQSLVAGYTDDESLRIAEGQYVVFGDHTRAVKWVDFVFSVGADGTKVLRAAPGLLPRFAYYAMANLDIPDRGYNRHWTIVRDLRIPIPPLEVQREIARILDQFTLLEAELEAELEARGRQYEYYLSSLFENLPAGTPLKTFTDVGVFSRGGGPQKKDFIDSGVGCIHYGQIYVHYGVSATVTNKFVSAAVATRAKGANPGDVVIAVTSENDDDLARSVAWLGSDRVAVSNHTLIFTSEMEPRFVSYYLRSRQFDSAKRKYISGTKVKSLPLRAFEKIQIPVPPLAEQVRIADLLDNFDTLVNSISIGLPAELAARRKQYEYYRDKLLTFEEAAS